MKYLFRAVIAALTLAGASAAESAVVVYEGTITPPVTTVTGTVGGFGFVREVASDVDFWSFAGVAGTSISIRGTRLDAALDPALDLYFGITTGESLFRTGQSWGGLQYLTSSDDVVDPPSGPFGDPFIQSFRLPSTGTYTIAIGGAGSDDEGPYRYSLSVQVVPEPATALLFLAGIAGIGWKRRSRSLE